MVERDKLVNFFLIVIIFVCLILIVVNFLSVTGYVTQRTTLANVTIGKYFSVYFSDGLEEGINFGDVAVLPVIKTNATRNYDGFNSATNYFMGVSNDSNVNVDFCVVASGDMQSESLDILNLSNEFYSNSTFSDFDNPLLNESKAFDIDYVKTHSGIIPGSNGYYRFWLDIPAAQPSGTYSNNITFKGIVSGDSC